MTIREPAWCPDCERSTGAACARHWTGPGVRTWVDDTKDAARAEEREACARLCDLEAADGPTVRWGIARDNVESMQAMARHLAKLIRARGERP